MGLHVSRAVEPIVDDGVRFHRGLGLLLLGLALGFAASALLGPLVADVIRYRTSDTTLNQIVGADAATLLVVAPLAALAGVLAMTGHRAAHRARLGAGRVWGLHLRPADHRAARGTPAR
jgi:hypothetical protein